MQIGKRLIPTEPRTTGKGNHFAVKYSVPSPIEGGFTVRWFAYTTREAAEAKVAQVGKQASKIKIVRVTSKQASEIFQCHWDSRQDTDEI
jgi:hypothetical protein